MIRTVPLPSPLTSSLAQEIAAETSRIIGFNVLVTDRDGVVIGSGDVDRVGSVHEASIDVIRTRREALHTAEQARALHGVKPGMTLPIVLDGEALGTVGITGSPARIHRFGLLVQRHTEILVREAILLRSRLVRDRAVTDFVRDIALFDDDVITGAALTQRAAELGIDLDRPRIAIVIDLPAEDGAVSAVRTVRESFHDPHDVVAETATGRITVLHAATDVRAARERLRLLSRQQSALAAHIGISDPAVGVTALHDACHDAADALRIAPNKADPIVPIADVRVHQLLAAAGHHARSRFADLLLRGLRAETDWPTQRETVLAWVESGFNLVRAARALHIHRNTLLYRLDKITTRSGRDVRDPHDALALYLACLTEAVTTPA
ncbi:MAG TPA: sugar diacid recognition domain-containing protein [Pseudonocardiaceae bacterium]|jgi:carbohydrate diacid regulator|nr:sugar diacid recognition domain-containing protein [Pseudonocardiaceae bacterium]